MKKLLKELPMSTFEDGVDRFALVVVASRAYPVASCVLEADAVEVRGKALCVLRDGRVRFQIAARDVVRVIGFPTQKSAADALREQVRGGHGGSTVHVHELASADRGRSVTPERRPTTTARGGPAEGIAFRVDEG